MKCIKMALLGLIAYPLLPAMADTEDNYLCGHRVEGSTATFGQTHHACDVDPFGDVEFVEQKFSSLIYDDLNSDSASYVDTLYPVLRDAASYYINQRQAQVSADELAAWQNTVMAVAQQQSYWTHYRMGSDSRLKMSRGNNGHGHGLMQVDDREHFSDIEAGKGWNLFQNLSFALDSLYAGWIAYDSASCAATETDLSHRAKFSYAVYSGGTEQGCRFEATDNQWQALDHAFASAWQNQDWLSHVTDPNADAVVDAACYIAGEEGCVPLGPLPAPKADIGSIGKIIGESFDGNPNTIAACRGEPNADASNVEWIRTTTNPWATASILTLIARQGDWAQVSFEYSGLVNTCWTLEYAITWDGFEPPPPANDILFAYKQLVLDSGETCLHNNGEFHCVTQSKDALCLLEKLDQVVEPNAFQLTAAQSSSQSKMVYDRHSCLTNVNSIMVVGDNLKVLQELPVYNTIGGDMVGTTEVGKIYQILDVVADTKYQINRYYKVLLAAAYTAEPVNEGEDGVDIPAVTGYFFAGDINTYAEYTEATDSLAANPVILTTGSQFKVDSEEGLSMLAEVGGAVTLTIPNNTIITIEHTEVLGDTNQVYYHIHRKGIDGVVYGGTLTPQLALNADLSASSEPATTDETPNIVTSDSSQTIVRGGSAGWQLLLLGLIVMVCRMSRKA
ncbi:hypothetical protein L0668_06840 [Paraglaciecola aquimarina]|uniref:GlyGly-CTERM sorting domain-containing protein n=1 Tax=Paraglaciecola algarum TaxID=3050085 RepID=A0ABS9D4W9_9ALTE|nr:hypothetical protein [Paraglaciecola sp. G1-23]MCF2947815.1 hypothetical protein [Paraglaciecola sp. G1-23]